MNNRDCDPMGDIDIKLSLTSTESKDNVSKQKQPKYSTTIGQQLNESENLGTSHCTMTNTMPTTTTTILTNAHPSAVTEDSISSPSTSSSLAMTPTSTTTVIAEANTFDDCVNASSTTTNALQLTQHPQSSDDSISGLATSTTSVMLNGTNSFNNSNINNNTIDTLDIKLVTSVDSLKSPDLCLSSSSSSINGAVVPPSILIPPNTSCGYSSNPEQGSGGAMWSNIDDGSHMTLNGYNNYQNYNSSPMFNGASPNSIAAAISQHNRRAITASHGSSGYQQHGPHGLSPNSMNRSNSMVQTPQSQQSQPKQVGFNNNFPTWSNPPPWPTGSGQPQQQQQQQKNSNLQQQQQQAQQPSQQTPTYYDHNHQLSSDGPGTVASGICGYEQKFVVCSSKSWNRGRSVPNLNPMTNVLPNRKPTSPNPGLSPSAYSGQQNIATSPSKYRRSTSFPGKVQGHGGYPGPMDVQGGIDDGRETYMQYQERNGMGNGLDMRSLEHCLSDLMRGCADSGPPDHLKGYLNNPNTLQSLAQLHGKPYYGGGMEDHISEEAGGYVDGSTLPLGSPARSSPQSLGSEVTERFSRKVFVGGLPPDIDEDEITSSFRRFGPLVVDWPHKAESKSYFPPKGYAFLLFQDESSVQSLIEACITDDDKLYLCVSSPTIKDKPVQIRPWRLSDADFVLDASMPLDPRKTVFVGGVPRPLKAVELAMIMNRLYGGVCYAGIDTDPELKYPKGAGRVAFSNQQSYIAAISARFVQLQHGDIDKRVEVKPYVLDDQMCDECQGQRCSGKFAPFFCANVTCLQYYCEHCWTTIHSRPGREYHKPLVKEGADRPRAVPFRWC